MDERHWWIAGKIQESFKLGSFESSTMLEDFIREENTLAKVNKFLRAGGPCRLFFYREKSVAIYDGSTKEIQCTGNLATLKDSDLEHIVILYFLRNNTEKDVDPSKIEKDIFCGELKANTIETLNSLLGDIYVPLFKAQRNWGRCNETTQDSLMHSMDKFVTALNETAASITTSKSLMLRQPENISMNDFKMQRAAALDTQLIAQYEELVTEWINTIEAILNDTSDERFLDPSAGPLSELERWRRRQRLLSNIAEQLKGKECKAVLAVLIAAKSKLLKKWKITDAWITEAINDTKDKVKFLESLKRHFDAMYVESNPSSLMSTALPGLMSSIKQMESISRFYAKTGFLGMLLTKTSNQLVQVCKDHIKLLTYNTLEDRDELWERIAEEVFRNKNPQNFNKQITEDSLYSRLKSCSTLLNFYRDSIRSLRESLGATQAMSHFSSSSSFSTVNNPLKKGTGQRGASNSPSKRLEVQGHGVLLTDEEAILSHFETFCSRIRQVSDMMNTIIQYNNMSKCLLGLPRPRKEDLVLDETLETDKQEKDPLTEILERTAVDEEDDYPSLAVYPGTDRTLKAIEEGEEAASTERMDADDDKHDKKKEDFHKFMSFEEQKGLTQDELNILDIYYPNLAEDEGPSVSTVVEQYVTRLNSSMKDNINTKVMLDVESKMKETFESHFSQFQEIVQDLEYFLGAYLHAIFMRKMSAQSGLEIITKFNPIAMRPGVKGTVSDKYVEIFGWYEKELNEVQNIYEKHKENPLMIRNAPPVAGAIHWSRQLLKRIEDPMKIFRDSKAVSSLSDFSRQVKTYNRLATALVTFESLWFTQWKNRIEHSRAGLRSTLFVLDPATGNIVVNADDRVIELIHEAKWMTRLGIQVPDSALDVLQQESRFKNYKAHLELVLKDFSEARSSIPPYLEKLFSPHVQQVYQQLQPGLSTLAWNSMNIDAFLHQIHSATDKLKSLTGKVNTIMEEEVVNIISDTREFCLYDLPVLFSQTWPLTDFKQTMMDSIRERSSSLKERIVTVLKSLQKVINLLSSKKSERKGSSKDKLHMMLDDEGQARERQQAALEDANSAELVGLFKEQIYESVLSATTMSLACLADAAGCTGEVVRAFTPLSNLDTQSECSSPSPRAAYLGGEQDSRANSAQSQGRSSRASNQPVSVLTNLSEMTWSPENTLYTTQLQFEVSVKFCIPNIIVEPKLEEVQTAISDAAAAILDSNDSLSELTAKTEESFCDRINSDNNVQELFSQLTSLVQDVRSVVNHHLFHFSYYNFLWRDDMYGNFEEFISSDPGLVAINREVDRYLNLEKKVTNIPAQLPVGAIRLFSDPIKDALHGFSVAWKTKFASVLHEEGKKRLDSAVAYRTTVKSRLEGHVQTLDQLNSTLHLLEELWDMENKIDMIYLPIETMYSKLREFELRLPREEIEEVDSLRRKWVELMALAEHVREVLLKERRGAFEQELDKQVKTFVVEVIQFRNSFDAQGPAVPGINPSEAVTRLHDFQHRYTVYDAKRTTLDSVSKLFGIPCKPFPELDKTGEELELLSQLYGLFQKFIGFDNKFRDTLWLEVNLEESSVEVEGYWDECLALPSKLKDWDAYNDLKHKLQTYLEVFPLLHKLASKRENRFNIPEIRNRHWLEVMQVTHSSFQLEGNIFKLSNLLDIGLIKHKAEIEEICQGAERELELEIKMRITEEDWTEQVLNFDHYKKRGPMYLDKTFTERLLEQLEDAEALLALMLTSRYIGPLRDEAASWAEKLKEVAEVLELWLEVQDLWQYLESVFSNPLAVRELPQEAKRFSRIDKGWTKMMKRAFDTRNVLQCCYGGEVPKAVVLRHIHEELEICFKSLVGYLDNKRKVFPRFYFLSDPILLALLSRPSDLESVRPHLKSIFSAIADIKLEKTAITNRCEDEPETDVRGVPYTRGQSRTPRLGPSPDKASSQNQSTLAVLTRSNTPPKIDKRLHQVYNINPAALQQAPSMLPSESLVDDVIIMDATEVQSSDGDVLQLLNKVTLSDGVEVWLEKVRTSVGQTLKHLNQRVINDCMNGVSLEEWALKYPAQVCRTGMLFHWSHECEAAIADLKYDRKSLQAALRKYNLATGKLTSALLKGAWRISDEPMLQMHKVRLEAMVTQSTFLKDILENLGQRKLREITDFEWRRCVRCYLQSDPALVLRPNSSVTESPCTGSEDEEDLRETTESKPIPRIWILDQTYEYGKEFYGTETGISPTPVTEKCFLSMSCSLKHMRGSLLLGPPGVGKTETIKGLANILGNFIGLFQLSKDYDVSGIGKIAQGIAMDGCWGCFDEAQNLNRSTLALLLDYAQSIYTALRARLSHMYLVDGTQIPVKKTVSLFMGVDSSQSPRTDIPSDVTETFRQISVLKPDFSMILRAKCSALGFKSPAVLANRLKALKEFVQDQLPREVHHQFSAQALVGVLRRAYTRRRRDKTDRTADRRDVKDEASRSESQSSETPTGRSLHQREPSLPLVSKPGQLGGAKKPGTPNPLTNQGKQEHALVAETITEMISPRLSEENQALFKSIVSDCFNSLPAWDGSGSKLSAKSRTMVSPKLKNQTATKGTKQTDIEPTIENKALDLGLVAHKPWVNKCVQLYNLSQVYNGVIVAGPTGSGKSKCIQTMVESLNNSNSGISRPSLSSRTSSAPENINKLLRINPMVVDDSALMFGKLGNNNEWIDGIVTHAMRKANRNISTTWLCFDGQLSKSWSDHFSTILTGDKIMHLKNGDKLFLSEGTRVLFETSDLESASPLTIASCGILYMDSNAVGWKPVARAWLDSRSPAEQHVLQRAFEKTFDPIVNFVLNDIKPRVELSEIGMIKTCLGLLDAMLADNIEVSRELHIERLFLFCLIWTLGGHLYYSDRKPFSDLVTTLSTALPDDDRDINVFDYYVDESGEWDQWHARVPETSAVEGQNILGEVLVDTMDTIRTRILMEFAAVSGQNVLLIGPHGSGKTALISQLMDGQDPQTCVTKRLVFSASSTAHQLQQFIDANIFHRQGFVYGAKDNKQLKLFVDDLNLPAGDGDSVQRCNEYLRQLLDESQYCTLQKPFEWKRVEGLSVMSAMAISEYEPMDYRTINKRLLRHFAVFWLPTPEEDSLKTVVRGILEVNISNQDAPSLDLDLQSALVSVSCNLLTSLKSVLRPTPMPGRSHYLFTLRDVTKCFQCLRRLADESRADTSVVVSFWRHEMTRIVRDRLTRATDISWFNNILSSQISETWPDLKDLQEHFVTFSMDSRVYQRPVTSVGSVSKTVKINPHAIDKLQDLHGCLSSHLTRYNEEFGNIPLNINLSDFVISHLVRMHRILSLHHGGNIVLVGAVGSHLSTLSKLALHVANIPIHKVDTSKQSSFLDGLRSAIRLSGSEGKVISLLFTARDLQDRLYLDALNGLLTSGEYPHLFSNDELDGLLQAIHPAIKREFPNTSVDPMKFFISRLKSNLHIIICMPLSHQLLKNLICDYPGLLTGCQMNWLCDWPQEALLGEANYFLAKHQLTEDFEDLRDNVSSSIANIHSFALRDCNQIPWAGDVSPEVTLTSLKAHEKKRDQIKTQTDVVPNLPYSKLILQERIKMNHLNENNKANNEVFVGPTTYRRFMETFACLYNKKSKERTESVERLKKVVATLDKIRADAKLMKKGINTTADNLETATQKTANLLSKLTGKATTLEKLKAKVGLSKSLDAYLQLTELDVEETEGDELLQEEEYDDYDREFDKMREANLKTRQVQAKEELETAKQTLEDCRHKLAYAKQQVIFWKSKVDRSVIEHVRAFASPPMLVGQIIEMVMVLVGKRLPSQRLAETKEVFYGKDEMSSRMSSSSGSTKLVIRKSETRGRSAKSKEGGERFDRIQWKSMTQTMQDSVKFVDILHNVSWQDGLPNDVLAAVESFLAVNRDGQLGVTGEGTLLENAQEKEFQAVKQRSSSPGGRGGITISGAKYASEACATLVHYTIAIVEYSRLCGPLKSSIERLNELEREIEENERQQRQQEEEPEEESKRTEEDKDDSLSEADISRIEEELGVLQQEFDQSVVEKHTLSTELNSMNERLRAAVEMVDSLKPQESKWRQEVKDNDSNELLLANCITAAAALTYCGAVNIDTRQRMGKFFLQVCDHHGIPLHKQQLFRNTELIDFLYKPLDVIDLDRLNLPTTRLMLENACYLMQEDSKTAWPLICDHTNRAVDWLKSLYQEKPFVVVKYHELRSQLENCLADGSTLLVTDCDVQELVNDRRFTHTISRCLDFINGTARFKVIVLDHEVECDPEFRLYMHTTSEPQNIPPQLAAYTANIYFQQSRACVEEELLNVFMAHEKSRIDTELSLLKQEKQENMQNLEQLEEDMLKVLSSDVRLMNDLHSTKKLAELKKHFDETLESQWRVESNEDSIMKAREGFRVIARRAAVCFDTSQYMREVHPLYRSSFRQFMTLYKTAIAHSERSSMKAVIDRLTWSAFTTTARSLLDKDRFIYSLLLAIEVEESNGHVGAGEREFIISPNYSSMVMSASSPEHTADAQVMASKKPFDWMLDEQFHNLQVLAAHFEWFKEMFDRMPRDGRETQWRNLCESELPENIPLPDKMDEVYKALQRLCIVRAVRSDRLIQASTRFIHSVLGKKYIGDIGIDFTSLVKQSTPSLPILIFFKNESEMTVKLFQEFAQKKQMPYQVIKITGGSATDERVVKKQISKSMAEGSWLLLHNAHNAPRMLDSIDTQFTEDKQTADSNFRLWISAAANANTIPVGLLQNSLRVFIDSPKLVKESLVRNLSWMSTDVIKQSNRAEWATMLHNLCFLHAAIQLRARFGTGGWNLPHQFYSIGFRELQEAVSFAVEEFRDPMFVMAGDGSKMPRTTSWTGIRYMLTEIIYGSFLTDASDQQGVSAMVDYWCSPNAVKKEFEIPKLKYKVPQVFFTPNVRLNSVIQAMDSLNNYFLEAPETCNLHPNIETLLGDDQYIFTRLNKIFDSMPSSPTLLHQLFPKPPTPFSGPPLACISNQSNNPLVVEQGVISSASYATYHIRKDVELWEICHTMLQKVPKAYNKEFILEKVKKTGGLTNFNNFFIKELEIMYKLLAEIRTTLQNIKTATETSLLGDFLCEHTVSIADDLFYQRIPEVWRRLSGESRPPLSYGLAQWMLELQTRCHHFEKIFTIGREKMPSYWLGAFFNPRGLLAAVKQEYIRNYSSEKQGNFELFSLQTEITSRDKDHLRDPPTEGIFVWGINVWGCSWDKTTGELQDLPPRYGCAALPVVHVTCCPSSDKVSPVDSSRATETYQCPVYHSRECRENLVMDLDVRKEGIPASRWALRGLSATIRPY